VAGVATLSIPPNSAAHQAQAGDNESNNDQEQELHFALFAALAGRWTIPRTLQRGSGDACPQQQDHGPFYGLSRGKCALI